MRIRVPIQLSFSMRIQVRVRIQEAKPSMRIRILVRFLSHKILNVYTKIYLEQIMDQKIPTKAQTPF
jgi:hypothetical protein